MRLHLAFEHCVDRKRRTDEDPELRVVRVAELRGLLKARCVDASVRLRGLALDDGAVCERAQRRVEQSVGFADPAHVRRNEAERGERVAHGFFERLRCTAGRRRVQARCDRVERRGMDGWASRRRLDVRPVIDGMVDAKLVRRFVLHDERAPAPCDRALHVLAERRVERDAARVARQESGLDGLGQDRARVASMAVSEHVQRRFDERRARRWDHTMSDVMLDVVRISPGHRERLRPRNVGIRHRRGTTVSAGSSQGVDLVICYLQASVRRCRSD